jgi:hypothetical protein
MKGKMNVSIYMKGHYEEFHAIGRRENKANSKPFGGVVSQSEHTDHLPMHPKRQCITEQKK